MLAAALRAGAFVFAAYATGRVLSRRARAGDERRIEQLRRECGTDMLTGLLNRRGGQEKAETMLAMCRRCEKPMAVLMADIDHFKEYNDAYGHLAGDGALCRVGGALQSVLARSSDMVCRFGGEEFLLCTPCRDTAEAMRQAARLRRAVEELGPCAPDGCCAGPLTVSVGRQRARAAGPCEPCGPRAVHCQKERTQLCGAAVSAAACILRKRPVFCFYGGRQGVFARRRIGGGAR